MLLATGSGRVAEPLCCSAVVVVPSHGTCLARGGIPVRSLQFPGSPGPETVEHRAYNDIVLN